MKKIITSLLFISFSALVANAQSETKASLAIQTTPTSTADIAFEKEVHDFGTIDYAGDGTYAFKFTNTGKDPLIIADAKGSCGCTVPKWPKEPVLKGQSNFINVSYDTKRPGPFTKTVTINCNAKSATKVLTIKGVVKSQEQTEDATPFKKAGTMSPLENVK